MPRKIKNIKPENSHEDAFSNWLSSLKSFGVIDYFCQHGPICKFELFRGLPGTGLGKCVYTADFEYRVSRELFLYLRHLGIIKAPEKSYSTGFIICDVKPVKNYGYSSGYTFHPKRAWVYDKTGIFVEKHKIPTVFEQSFYPHSVHCFRLDGKLRESFKPARFANVREFAEDFKKFCEKLKKLSF